MTLALVVRSKMKAVVRELLHVEHWFLKKIPTVIFYIHLNILRNLATISKGQSGRKIVQVKYSRG